MDTDEKPISASDVVKDPNIVFEWMNQYVLLRDSSMTGTYKNLIEAINLLAERDWEALSIGGDASGYLFALCRNTKYKRKNEVLE
jgi:hypothetical protein